MTVVIQDINMDVFVWIPPLLCTDDCHLALFPQRTLAIGTMHQKSPLNKREGEMLCSLFELCAYAICVDYSPERWEAC